MSVINYYQTTGSESQNILARTYLTQDGHGGRAEEHRREMKEIAETVFLSKKEDLMKEINGMILQAQYRAYEQALSDVLDVLEYDVHSVTKIGIEGCKDIFEGKKAQKFISDQVMRTITKKLKSKHFRP